MNIFILLQPTDPAFGQLERHFNLLVTCVRRFVKDMEALHAVMAKDYPSIAICNLQDMQKLSNTSDNPITNAAIAESKKCLDRLEHNMRIRCVAPLKVLLALLTASTGPVGLLETRRHKQVDYLRLRRQHTNDDNSVSASDLAVARHTYEALVCLALPIELYCPLRFLFRLYTFQHHQLLEDLPTINYRTQCVMTTCARAWFYMKRVYYFERLKASGTSSTASTPSYRSPAHLAGFIPDIEALHFGEAAIDTASPGAKASNKTSTACHEEISLRRSTSESGAVSSGGSSTLSAKNDPLAGSLDRRNASTIPVPEARRVIVPAFVKSMNSPLYVCCYRFVGQNAAEVNCEPGDVVAVLCRHDVEGNDQWWYVEKCVPISGSATQQSGDVWDGAGERGYLPSTYLRPLSTTRGP